MKKSNHTYDKRPAILSIHAGTGGNEAEDFVSMLVRMYGRWARKHGLAVDELNLTTTDAGIKSATLRISGALAELQGEAGVHRLQRVSPFGGGERHTSFALVEVLDEKEEAELTLDEAELREEFSRGSGPGGQARNKQETAVRLVHLPTETTVTISNGRSQWENRQAARAVLRARLAAKAHQGPRRLGAGQGGAWGLQKRTYTQNPQERVIDHESGVKAGSFKRVLDGEIEKFLGRSG